MTLADIHKPICPGCGSSPKGAICSKCKWEDSQYEKFPTIAQLVGGGAHNRFASCRDVNMPKFLQAIERELMKPTKR